MDFRLILLGLLITVAALHVVESKSLLANLMHQAKTLQHGLELADRVGNLGMSMSISEIIFTLILVQMHLFYQTH